jgi:HNH endonuclease
LRGGLRIGRRITGNSIESLGLHPVVYFTNEKGKHSRFLFLGMCALIGEKLRNNNDQWFRRFTKARRYVETFLLENKSVIGIVLQNLGRKMRISKMSEMLEFLVSEGELGRKPEAATVFKHMGLKGKIYDLTTIQRPIDFTPEVKSEIFLREGIKQILECPICGGYLDTNKSVSYDHVTPRREGGLGTAENGQLVHPYCNSIRG